MKFVFLLLLIFSTPVLADDYLNCGYTETRAYGTYLSIENNGIAQFKTTDGEIILFSFSDCTVTRG